MSITLPEGITLPQEHPLASFLGGMGTGLGAGAEKGGTYMLQQMLTQQKAEAAAKAKLATGAYKDLKSRFGSNWEGMSIPEQTRYEAYYKQRVMEGAPVEQIINEIDQQMLATGVGTPEPGRKGPGQQATTLWQDLFGQVTRPKEEVPRGKAGPPIGGKGERNILTDFGPDSPFARGTHSGFLGKASALASGQSLDEYQKATALDDKAGVWDNFLHAIGNYVADSPAYLVGGALGAAGGGPFAPATGAAGAFALPRLLNSSLEEFMKHKQNGWKGSFEDYLDSAGKVASESLMGGAAGSLFGTLGSAIPAIKAANPAIKGFMEAKKLPKLKEYLGTSMVQALGLTGAEAVAKRELPTKADVANTFAQVFGFNLMHAVPGLKSKIYEKASKSGVDPTKFAEKVKSRFEEIGGTEEGLKGKKTKDTNLLNRAVNDITKELIPEAAKVAKAEKRVADVGKKALEKKEIERKEYAEAIGKEPVEEYITKPKMTIKEKELFKERASTESKVKALEKEISRYQKEVDRLKKDTGKKKTDFQKWTKNTLENLVEQRTLSLKEAQERLKQIGKEIKAVAPKPGKKMTPEQQQFYLDKHMRELKQMSMEPKGDVAEDWNKMFKQDQKYQKQHEEMMKRGKIPGAEYVGENIKILDRYMSEYEALKRLSKEQLKTAKGKEKAMLQRLLKNIETNSKINRNKRAVWERYRSVKEAVRKPFIAKMLKDMGHNLGRHERVIFEAKKVLGQTEAKAQEAWKEFKENPTNENLKDAAEKSGMDGEKTVEAVDTMEDAIKSEDSETLEEKTKDAYEKMDDAAKSKDPKAKKGKGWQKFLSTPSAISALLNRMGIPATPELVRAGLLLSGYSSITTLRGVIRTLTKQYHIQQIRIMRKRNDNKGIDAKYRRYMKGGGTQATWNKWLKEAA